MSQARQFSDSLSRLTKRFDLKSLPFSDEELHTLAIRGANHSGRKKKREQLDRYKAHLAALYGEDRVDTISAALEDINNAIGYEEK